MSKSYILVMLIVRFGKIERFLAVVNNVLLNTSNSDNTPKREFIFK